MVNFTHFWFTILIYQNGSLIKLDQNWSIYIYMSKVCAPEHDQMARNVSFFFEAPQSWQFDAQMKRTCEWNARVTGLLKTQFLFLWEQQRVMLATVQPRFLFRFWEVNSHFAAVFWYFVWNGGCGFHEQYHFTNEMKMEICLKAGKEITDQQGTRSNFSCGQPMSRTGVGAKPGRKKLGEWWLPWQLSNS